MTEAKEAVEMRRQKATSGVMLAEVRGHGLAIDGGDDATFCDDGSNVFGWATFSRMGNWPVGGWGPWFWKTPTLRSREPG